MERELIRGNFRVLLTDETNEGNDGDYNEKNPDDFVHLRFYVDQRSVDPHLSGWDGVEDASYCTGLAADASAEVLDAALNRIADALIPMLERGESIRRKAEDLSWLGYA